MAFTPTSFPASGVLQAATIKQNDDDLRKYLHEGIVSGDLQSSPAWIDTQHIQPPKYQPRTNIQHGVTGHLGGRVYRPGQWYTMTAATFTRRGRGTESPSWAEVPTTAVTFDLRGATTAVFHYHFAVYVHPDKTELPFTAAEIDRRGYVAPYFRDARSPFKGSQVYEPGALETRMNVGTAAVNGFSKLTESGARVVYNVSGYGQRTGQYLQEIPAAAVSEGQFHCGLAHWSLAHLGLVTSWSVCVEAYY